MDLTFSLVWLTLLVIFVAAEAATVTMISLWFAAGALAALIAAMLGGSLGLQVALFLVVSTALLLSLRPLVRRYVNPKKTATNADAVIGSKGYVTGDIDNDAAVGQVKLGGMVWTARSSSGHPIAKGTLVQVDRIEGVKVYVSPAPVPAHIS